MSTPAEPTPETASLASEDPQRAAASAQTPRTGETFDQVLEDLARPPAVGPGLAHRLAALAADGADHTALLEAAKQAARPAGEPGPGTVLQGSYRILEVLGRGGMGVVLEAENLRTGKRVAIKWMSSDRGPDPARVVRFRREARAIAKIQHPNVIDIYDVGDNDGTPFLVMERLRGESLRSRLARGPLAWDEARALMLGILRGMTAVHRAGVVHRDLKPDNIFLCADDRGTPTPKVLDFGIAAMRGGSEEGLDSLTRTGSLIGTPCYMPLEQLTGGEVDLRADVYALGVVFYEMLTRRLPFPARSSAELAVLQATVEPTRPSQHQPSLRGAREQLLLRALARKPGDRYADAGAFLTALGSDVAAPRRARLLPVLLALALAGGCALLYASLTAEAPARTATEQIPRAAPEREPQQTEPEPGPRQRAEPLAPAPEQRPAPTRQPATAAPPARAHRPQPATAAPEPAPKDERNRLEIRLDEF